jgi:putative oxidoreductase
MSNKGLRPWGLTILRLVIGTVFLIHGWQKISVFGLTGVTGMLAGLGIPLPNVAAVILIMVELLGGALLIVGLGTRWAATLIAIDMLVAILTVHMKHGFFSASQGVEFPLTLAAGAVCLALAGPGAASIDQTIRTQVDG